MNFSLTFPLAETSFADVSLDYQEAVVARGFPIWGVAVLIAVAVAIGVAVWAFRNRSPEILDTPLGLLHELCKTHRIGGKGRRLLQRMAEEASMDHPAMLFAGPEHLDSCIQHTRDKIDFESKHASTIGRVRRTLYG